MKIVLDTNCLIQIFSVDSDFRWIFDEIVEGDLKLSVTTEILLEYEEIFNRFFESETLGGVIANIILSSSELIKQDVYYRWKLIDKDPDDDKFVDCAIAANADFLISDDAHFKILKKIPFPKVQIIRLEEFAKTFKTQFK